MSDVYMPDMDGFKLLELIGLEMDIPLISKFSATDPAGKRFRYVCFSLEQWYWDTFRFPNVAIISQDFGPTAENDGGS